MVFLIERQCVYCEMREYIWARRKKQMRKAKIISAYLSPHLSKWNNSDTPVHISLKFYTGEITKLRRPVRIVWLKLNEYERPFA